VKAPSAKEVAEALRKGHPRLVLTNARLGRIKRAARGDGVLRKAISQVLRSADGMAGKPLAPGGSRGAGAFFRRMYTLGLAWRLTGRVKYAKAEREDLLKVASMANWRPSYFLDTAMYLHGTGIGYDWFYSALSKGDREKIRAGLVKNGLTVGAAAYKNNVWWSKWGFNWNQVTNSALAIAALSVAESEPALAGEIVPEAIGRLPFAIRSYGPDGAWAEGANYWEYATLHTVCGIAALRTALGGDYGLSKIPGFIETGMFPIYITGPSGLHLHFSDCPENRRRRSVLVQDEMTLEKSCEFAWGMTTSAKVAVSGNQATLRQNGKRCRLTILEPKGAVFTIESAAQKPPQKPNKGVSRLMIRLKDQKGKLRVADRHLHREGLLTGIDVGRYRPLQPLAAALSSSSAGPAEPVGGVDRFPALPRLVVLLPPYRRVEDTAVTAISQLDLHECPCRIGFVVVLAVVLAAVDRLGRSTPDGLDGYVAEEVTAQGPLAPGADRLAHAPGPGFGGVLPAPEDFLLRPRDIRGGKLDGLDRAPLLSGGYAQLHGHRTAEGREGHCHGAPPPASPASTPEPAGVLDPLRLAHGDVQKDTGLIGRRPDLGFGERAFVNNGQALEALGRYRLPGGLGHERHGGLRDQLGLLDGDVGAGDELLRLGPDGGLIAGLCGTAQQ